MSGFVARVADGNPRSAFQAVRDAARLAKLPMPDLEPAPDVKILDVDQTTGKISIEWNEAAARWVGGLLAWCDEKKDWITAQRKEMKADVDREADDVVTRIAEIDTKFREMFGKELQQWVRDNAPKKKKSVKLMTVEIGNRLSSAAPKRIENPIENAALIEWVEKNLGYEFIERKPTLKWKEVKERLVALGIERGVQGRAVIICDPLDGNPLMDAATGESLPMLVPGVEVSEAGEILWASSIVTDKHLQGGES